MSDPLLGLISTFPDGSYVDGTFEGYVASPTDLYYKGNNAAGFLVVDQDPTTTIEFETTYIFVTSTDPGTDSVAIKPNRSYNFAGYSTLYIEMTSDGAVSHSASIVRVYRDTNGGPIIKSFDSLSKGNNTLAVDLSEWQTTFTPVIKFVPHLREFQVTRIRIA